MKSLTTKIPLVVLALVICFPAWADLSNVAVTGTVWRVDGNMVSAPTTDPSGTLEGTFTANVIDFLADGPQGSNKTLGDFLAHGGANTAGMSGGLTDVMSNCFNQQPGGSGCYSTIIRIDGTTTFFGGTTYTLTHDDGANMIAGGNTVIASPLPTAEDADTWTPGSNTSGPFKIYYSATNGNPEVLKLEGRVPDGGTTLMFLGGSLFAIATLRRKFRL